MESAVSTGHCPASVISLKSTWNGLRASFPAGASWYDSIQVRGAEPVCGSQGLAQTCKVPAGTGRKALDCNEPECSSGVSQWGESQVVKFPGSGTWCV